MKLHPYIKNGYYISIFTNSENSKTSKPNVLTLKLTEKLDLRLGEKVIALSNLRIYYAWKNITSAHTITINLKYQRLGGMINLNYQMDHILYQIFRIILSIFQKKHGEDIDKPSVQIHVNKLKIELHLKLKMGIALNF